MSGFPTGPIEATEPAAPSDADAVTPAERAELEARIASHRADPSASIDWHAFEQEPERRFGGCP